MITVASTRPIQVEAMQFTVDNVAEVRKFVEFTGHTLQYDNYPPDRPGQRRYFINVRPGVVLTVINNEWLLYNLHDATWGVCSDKEFHRRFTTQS